MFRALLVPILFSSTLSFRSPTNAYLSLHATQKAKCAMFCHLPPPFHKWWRFLEDRCDPATSLFIDIDTSPLMQLEDEHLSVQDLAPAADFLKMTYEDTGYKILRADLDVAQGVLFGQVLDVEETEKRRSIITKRWTRGKGNEMRCRAVVALNEIAMLYKNNTSLPNFNDYKTRRSRCFLLGMRPVTQTDVEQAKIAAEEALPRTKMIATSGGREALLAKLAAALPPASNICGTTIGCLQSRFVNAASWDPPENLTHLYDKVIFVGCTHTAFEGGKAVESALKLVAPVGEIILDGYTPEDLTEKFGITFFDSLSVDWQRSTSDRLTIFSKRSELG